MSNTQESFTTRITRVEEDGEASIVAFQTTAAAGGGSHPVKCVCADCNHGWMEAQDAKLRWLLTRLVLGDQSGAISRLGCILVARWATKIAMLIDELWESAIPLATKREYGRTMTTPAGWSFWLAVRGESDDRTHMRAATLGPDPSSNDVEAVTVMFRVLHLIVQVLAPVRDDVALFHSLARTPYVRALWPRLDALQWPPPEHTWLASDDDEERLEDYLRAKRLHGRLPPE